MLIDPYISRLKYGGSAHPDDDRPNFARDDVAQPDTDLIDSIITTIRTNPTPFYKDLKMSFLVKTSTSLSHS